jgi:carbon monoxide dehydrogenase subunit G
LEDPEILVSCIPGAGVTAVGKAGVHGLIRLSLGTARPVFRGEMGLIYDVPARRCSMTARCIETRGKSRLTASGSITLSGDDRTELTLSGEFEVTGALGDAVVGSAAINAEVAAKFGEALTRIAALPGTPVHGADDIPLVGWEDFSPPPATYPPPALLAPPNRPTTIYQALQIFMRRLLPRISREQLGD